MKGFKSSTLTTLVEWKPMGPFWKNCTIYNAGKWFRIMIFYCLLTWSSEHVRYHFWSKNKIVLSKYNFVLIPYLCRKVLWVPLLLLRKVQSKICEIFSCFCFVTLFNNFSRKRRIYLLLLFLSLIDTLHKQMFFLT